MSLSRAPYARGIGTMIRLLTERNGPLTRDGKKSKRRFPRRKMNQHYLGSVANARLYEAFRARYASRS